MDRKQTPQERYHAKNRQQYPFDCMISTEQDIIQRLESVPNRSGYIKALIRKDIKDNDTKN
jgi:hypothetical protein